jgi:hypothetical protein
VSDCASLFFPPLQSTLIVLLTQLDLNPVAWASSSVAAPGSDDSLALKDAVDNVLVLCNAHLALRHENEIAVFAAGPGSRCVARLLFLLLLSISEGERRFTDPAISAFSRQLFSSRLFHSSSFSAPAASSSFTNHDSNIYQQFRIREEQLLSSFQAATRIKLTGRTALASFPPLRSLLPSLHFTTMRTSAFLLSALSLGASLVSASSDVVDLDQKTFTDFVSGDSPALVEFFAPWFVPLS